MNEKLDTLASRLKYLIEVKSLNDAALARIAGVTGPAITALCEGRAENPRVSTLTNIADAFRINLDWLIKGRGPIYWDQVMAVPSSRHSKYEKTAADQRDKPTIEVLLQEIEQLLSHYEIRPLELEQDGR